MAESENRAIEEILYDCIRELGYIQENEECQSTMCKSSHGAYLVQEGMKALDVKDLSQGSLTNYHKFGPLK